MCSERHSGPNPSPHRPLWRGISTCTALPRGPRACRAFLLLSKPPHIPAEHPPPWKPKAQQAAVKRGKSGHEGKEGAMGGRAESGQTFKVWDNTAKQSARQTETADCWAPGAMGTSSSGAAPAVETGSETETEEDTSPSEAFKEGRQAQRVNVTQSLAPVLFVALSCLQLLCLCLQVRWCGSLVNVTRG